MHYGHMCKNPVMSRNNSTAVTESTIVTNLGAFLDSAGSQKIDETLDKNFLS